MPSMVRFENREEVVGRFQNNQQTHRFADNLGAMFADRLNYRINLRVGELVALLVVTISDYAKQERYTETEYRSLLASIGDFLEALFDGDELDVALISLFAIAEKIDDS